MLACVKWTKKKKVIFQIYTDGDISKDQGGCSGTVAAAVSSLLDSDVSYFRAGEETKVKCGGAVCLLPRSTLPVHVWGCPPPGFQGCSGAKK